MSFVLKENKKDCVLNIYSQHSNINDFYKFSWILTLTEVISIKILPMRLISAIMNFYWSHAIPLQKLFNERSYKFSWIFSQKEVISI